MQDDSQELAKGAAANHGLGTTTATPQVGSQRLPLVEKMGFMFFYPLNKVKMAQVQSDLIERRRPSANRP